MKIKVRYKILLCLLLGSSMQAKDFKGNLRAFWFDGQRELRDDRTSLSVGGILSYQTQEFYNLSGLVSFFSSNGISSLNDMPDAGATSNLQNDGSSINVLGEAALKYRYENTVIKYGRQRINTPLVNDYYNRMLPNSFEGLSIENNSFDKTKIQAAYITGWKYKNAEEFISPTHNYGFDRDIALLGVSSTTGIFKITIFDYYIADVMNAVYFESRADKLLLDARKWNLSCGVQYLQEDSVGDSLLGLSKTYLVGLKVGLHYEDWTLQGMMTKVGDETLLGTGNDYSKMGWSSFITYTDIQVDGESENAGAFAFGGSLKRKINKNFEASIKYIHINQDDSKQSDSQSLTTNPRPDSNEYNIDATYKATKMFKLRTRFAYIDYDSKSTQLYKDKAYDEFNTRIIVDYFF